MTFRALYKLLNVARSAAYIAYFFMKFASAIALRAYEFRAPNSTKNCTLTFTPLAMLSKFDRPFCAATHIALQIELAHLKNANCIAFASTLTAFNSFRSITLSITVAVWTNRLGTVPFNPSASLTVIALCSYLVRIKAVPIASRAITTANFSNYLCHVYGLVTPNVRANRPPARGRSVLSAWLDLEF